MRKMAIFLLLMVSFVATFPQKAFAEAPCSGVLSGVGVTIPERASSHTVKMNLEGYDQNQEYQIKIESGNWVHINDDWLLTKGFKPGENGAVGIQEGIGTANITNGTITITTTQANLLARNGEKLFVVMVKAAWPNSYVCHLGEYITAKNPAPSPGPTGTSCKLYISQIRGGKSCYLGDNGCLTAGGELTSIEADIVADDGKPLSNDEPKPYTGWVRMDLQAAGWSGNNKVEWKQANNGKVKFTFDSTSPGNNTVTLYESEFSNGPGLRDFCPKFTFQTENSSICAPLCGEKVDVYEQIPGSQPNFELCEQISDGEQRKTCLDCFGENKVWTAIGCIPIEPTGIVQTLIRLGLGLGGGITLLLILAGAFRLSVSQGDPKAAEEAKEQITSAVIGLLFIIFSIVMLRFIGVQVLHIPGFGT